MREWVCGFLFDADAELVVLIRKNRPEWQQGNLNGVGGKLEEQDKVYDVFGDGQEHHGETIRTAMAREFEEETGLLVDRFEWHHFATLTWEEGIVHFLRSFVGADRLHTVRQTTDEVIEVHRVAGILDPDETGGITPNLLWLVPLAAHRHDTYDLIDVVETGTTLRKPGRLDVHPGGLPLRRQHVIVGPSMQACLSQRDRLALSLDRSPTSFVLLWQPEEKTRIQGMELAPDDLTVIFGADADLVAFAHSRIR